METDVMSRLARMLSELDRLMSYLGEIIYVHVPDSEQLHPVIPVAHRDNISNCLRSTQ
jgi:hypothetical protein